MDPIRGLEGILLLSEAIDELCTATRADGRSPRTVQSYAEKLSPLVRFLGDADVEMVTIGQLREYVARMMGSTIAYEHHPFRQPEVRELSRFTIASRVTATRRLFRWLMLEGIIANNPARRLRVPRPRRDQPKAVRPADVATMLASTAGGSLTDLRDRALILFLADTGARVGGIVRLRRQDVDLARGIALLREKGNRTRAAFYGRETARALRDWLALRPRVPDAPVFVSLGPRGGRLRTDAVTAILKRRARKANVAGPVFAHAFRHGFARSYLKAGGDLASCSRLMGHSGVEVTASYYAVFSRDELHELHERYTPMTAILEAVDG